MDCLENPIIANAIATIQIYREKRRGRNPACPFQWTGSISEGRRCAPDPTGLGRAIQDPKHHP